MQTYTKETASYPAYLLELFQWVKKVSLETVKAIDGMSVLDID